MNYQPPNGYRLVYTGGHHKVYCNGTESVWTFLSLDRSTETYWRRGSCQCDSFDNQLCPSKGD
jgi:hypothetical protein